MPSITNRIDKLERDQLEAAVARAKPITEVPDADLVRLLLEDASLPCGSDDVRVALTTFNRTGELPGVNRPAA